jgi:hypothetical protein
MNKYRRLRSVAELVLVGGSVAALAGCASAREDAVMTLPAPIAIEVASIAGTRVDIPLGNSAYIVVADGSEADYQARITGTSVSFTPGSVTDDLVMRPGLTTHTRGDSTVALTNTHDGTVTQFTVRVE